MDDLIKSFRVALEALDRVGANRVFDQALTRMSPINAVEQVVVPGARVGNYQAPEGASQ